MGKVVDLKITPEEEEDLKALRGYTAKHTFFWTHPLERKWLPKEKRAIWKLENRNARDIAEVEDNIIFSRTEEGSKTNLSNARINMLTKHVKGWKNYQGKDGKEIVCEFNEDGGVKIECIERISKDMQLALVDAINNEDELTDEERLGLEF